MILTQWIDQISDWNPQLFRELKGRFTVKNLLIISAISFVAQGLIYFTFASALPEPNSITNRYCIGTAPAGFDPNNYLFTSNEFCIKNALGNFEINWQYWWLEIFLTLTFMGFFLLLLGGVYLLAQDLSKEEKVGTLKFVQLSPQSSTAIAIGKILGVPSLLYLGMGLVLPLHLWAGLRGGIPIHLLLLFYGLISLNCLFFFSGTLLYALVAQGSPALKAWLITGALFYGMGMSTLIVLNDSTYIGNLTDGFLLFNPLHMIVFLVQFIQMVTAEEFYSFGGLDASFYGFYLGHGMMLTAFLDCLFYGIGIYWLTQAFKRRFHRINGTLLSKKQSYILTACLTIFSLGFTVQEPMSSSDDNIWLFNFSLTVVMATFYLLTLMSVLSPPYQSIQDWSRYQHHTVREWLLGERSPAFWAVMVNSAIAFGGVMIAALWVMACEYELSFGLGLILQIMVIGLLAIMAQLTILGKDKHRATKSSSVMAIGVVVPLIFLAANSVDPTFQPAFWFWTILPMVATPEAALTTILATILGQIAIITVCHQLMQYRLKQIGSSELQHLLKADA